MHPRALSPWMAGTLIVQPLVLVVADEREAKRSIVSTLAMNGFRSLHVGVREGFARALSHGPHLILVDASPPGVDGAGVTARIRDSATGPILVVLGRADEAGGAAVLDAGANDYIVHPFGAADLVSRIRIWLRQAARTGAVRPTVPPQPGLRLDRERRALVVDGREVHTTPLEYKLIMVLAQSALRPLSEERILEAVWGPDSPRPVHYLRALVRQLRQKIERDPARPLHLVTAPGAGYRLKLG
jgi:two-component system KDP operon response regulator KdpE